jgi:uncharacterized protein (TIGR03437 family)
LTADMIPAGSRWVFNDPFFLLLNVAVGGDFPGPPDATTHFPQDMLIDYVRVYQASVPAAAVNSTGVVDAASFGSELAPGELASVFGSDLATTATSDLFDPVSGAFPQEFLGTSVLVNGVAGALIFTSPAQINFQVPWETLTGIKLNVEVMRDGTLSNALPVVLSPAVPSVFAVDGIALLTCDDGSPQAGSACTLWGDGFGRTNPPQRDGKPSAADSLAPSATPCALTVGGLSAMVPYCGAAPGLIIDQISFIYPSGIAGDDATVPAEITIDGSSGHLLLQVSAKQP